MKFSKKCLFNLGLLLSLSLAVVFPLRAGGQFILARVGPEIITRPELEGFPDAGGTHEEILAQAVEQKLLYLRARDLGVDVSTREIEGRIDALAAGYDSRDRFFSLLEEDGITETRFRRMVRENLMAERVVTLEVRRRVEVDPRELERFVSRNREMLSRALAKVRLEQAVFDSRDDIPQSDLLLRSFMDDLGEIDFQSLSPDLQEWVARLEPGEMTPPLRLGNRWHVFRLVSIDRPDRDTDFPMIRAAHRILERNMLAERYEKLIEELAEKYPVKYF